MLHILIARAVKFTRLNVAESPVRREIGTHGVVDESGFQDIGQFLHAVLVIRIADIENAPVATAALVFDDPEQTLHAILDIRETTLLAPPVDQLNGGPLNQIEDELGDHPGTADAGRFQ
jgi:hypothetical protein